MAMSGLNKEFRKNIKKRKKKTNFKTILYNRIEEEKNKQNNCNGSGIRNR